MILILGYGLSFFLKQKKFKDSYFLGIGSILTSENPHFEDIKDKRKIVFGTGIRPSSTYNEFSLDKTWSVKFLRGPLSSGYLGNKHEYISDAAYAVRQLAAFSDIQNTKKKYEISIMPYFHSVQYFDWEKIAKKLGYHLISPYSEGGVEHTLREIAASKYLITEAMHGAILADILRVPWHRFVLTTPYTEGERISDFKWNDWMGSIDIPRADTTFIPFYKKTRLHEPIKKITGNILSTNFFVKSQVQDHLMKSLSSKKNYTLSKDTILSTIDSRIYQKVQEMNNGI
ncbi:polysaccharide pyruvyl transferase family protein [Zobellia laminariae]|uniref:polysaccharide pyruvyl transferase family protein n=1 Tax=Zobellia laminariae TaxID=248906 RepID=UPI004056759F